MDSCLRALDDLEAALRADAEGQARERMDDSSKEEAVAQMQRDAEERDRDPRVKALVEDARNIVSAPEGTSRTRGTVLAFADKMERALALEPDFYQASLQLTSLYYAHGYAASAIDRARDAYERTPGCLSAYIMAGQACEDVGLHNVAEEEYAKCIGATFDYADSWVSLSRMSIVKFGAISNAVKLMRIARLGGPEGKFTKPGKHPLLLFTLAHALHLTGYSAEPTSLYTQAFHAGAGIMSIYPLARLAYDADDEEGVSSWVGVWRRARDGCASSAESAESLYASLELFNAMSGGAQWHEILTSKVRGHRLMVGDVVRTPRLVDADSIEEVVADDEVFVLKGAHTKYPGIFGEEINRVGPLKTFRAHIKDASARRRRGEIIAQQYVRDVATDEFGRKCTMRVRASFVPNRDAGGDVAYIGRHVGVYSATETYDKSSIFSDEFDDAMFLREFTNRGPSGDESSAAVREIDITEACTRVMGLDDISTDIIAQCESALAALRTAVRDEKNVIQDARYDAYAAVGAPLFLNFEFLVESADQPRAWLIGIDGRPKFKRDLERAFVRDVWSRAFDALENDSPAKPPASEEILKVFTF